MAAVLRKSGFTGMIKLFVIMTVVFCCDARNLPGNRHHNGNNKNFDEEAVSSVQGFVQVRGTQFDLNGSPFLFNGFNSYWMLDVATVPSNRDKVTGVFRDALAAGLTVCRTWAFSDGGTRALQVSPGVYDEGAFQALDFVISEAGRYGIRLILSLTNNYRDFGGRPQYVQWARNAGEALQGDDDFYTNPVVKGYYKNNVLKVLTRINTITGVVYKDDPTVMAWELMNEPRCQVDPSGNTVNQWVVEMAPYVKSIDSNHLLAIGMEGFYGDSVPDRKQYNPGYQVGTDFIKSNLVKQIDFGTIHAYPDVWLSGQNENAQTNFVQRWMDSHMDDSRKIIGKPLVFTEFGKSKKDPDYSLDVRDSYMNAVYADIYNLASIDGGAFAGGLVWQIMAEGMDTYCDGYEIVLSQEASTNSIISQQSSKMAALEHQL